MKFFTIRVGLFLLPITVLFLLPLYIFYSTGEFTSDGTIIQAQQNTDEPILYGKAYITSGIHYSYKLASVVARHPAILVLGDSRVLQFRSKFFEGATFYNGGGSVGGLQDLTWLLEQIPEDAKPSIVIVGLDQPYFHEIWDTRYYTPRESNERAPSFIHSVLFGIRQFYLDVLYRKYTFSMLFCCKGHEQVLGYGIDAFAYGKGVLNDGSFSYGSLYDEFQNQSVGEERFGDVLKRIKDGNRLLEHGVIVSDSSVAYLESFLAYAHEHDIHVIGFLPPYAHYVYEIMHKDNTRYVYMNKIVPRIKPLFEVYGFSLFDFSDLAFLGAGDEESLDGLHASEKAYVRLTLHMAEKDPILADYVNMHHLNQVLAEEEDPFRVFEY